MQRSSFRKILVRKRPFSKEMCVTTSSSKSKSTTCPTSRCVAGKDAVYGSAAVKINSVDIRPGEFTFSAGTDYRIGGRPVAVTLAIYDADNKVVEPGIHFRGGLSSSSGQTVHPPLHGVLTVPQRIQSVSAIQIHRSPPPENRQRLQVMLQSAPDSCPQQPLQRTSLGLLPAPIGYPYRPETHRGGCQNGRGRMIEFRSARIQTSGSSFDEFLRSC